jgi:hypothetical protein
VAACRGVTCTPGGGGMWEWVWLAVVSGVVGTGAALENGVVRRSEGLDGGSRFMW